MATSIIAATLCAQFDRVWNTFRDALSRLDDEQFVAGDAEWCVPREQAYHIVETADFYASDCEPEGFAWGHYVATNKEQVLAYTEQIEAKVKQWLSKHSDEQLLEPQPICVWTGTTVLDRALYALRHIQHHTAQINLELRRRGLPDGEWQ